MSRSSTSPKIGADLDNSGIRACIEESSCSENWVTIETETPPITPLLQLDAETNRRRFYHQSRIKSRLDCSIFDILGLPIGRNVSEQKGNEMGSLRLVWAFVSGVMHSSLALVASIIAPCLILMMSILHSFSNWEPYTTTYFTTLNELKRFVEAVLIIIPFGFFYILMGLFHNRQMKQSDKEVPSELVTIAFGVPVFCLIITQVVLYYFMFTSRDIVLIGGDFVVARGAIIFSACLVVWLEFFTEVSRAYLALPPNAADIT
jgi:hypothetical protein